MHFLIQMKKYSPTTLSAQCLLLFLLSYQQNLSTASENAQSKSYIVYMGERKHINPSLVVDSHHTILASVLGGSKQEAADSIFYSYKHGFSGFATRLTDSQAEMMAGNWICESSDRTPTTAKTKSHLIGRPLWNLLLTPLEEKWTESDIRRLLLINNLDLCKSWKVDNGFYLSRVLCTRTKTRMTERVLVLDSKQGPTWVYVYHTQIPVWHHYENVSL